MLRPAISHYTVMSMCLSNFRQMKEKCPDKLGEVDIEEQQLLIDFWFHFIHYLEPCCASDNAENIPPGIKTVY